MIFSRIDPGSQLVIGCRKAANNTDVQVRNFRDYPLFPLFHFRVLLLNYSKIERSRNLLQILFWDKQEPQPPAALNCDSPGEASFSGVNDTQTSVCSYLLFFHDCYFISFDL